MFSYKTEHAFFMPLNLVSFMFIQGPLVFSGLMPMLLLPYKNWCVHIAKQIKTKIFANFWVIKEAWKL